MPMSPIAGMYELAVLATASYVRMGGRPESLRTNGATFASEAANVERQAGGRLPISLARQLFDPAFALPGETQWNILAYYGGDIPASDNPIAGNDKSGFAATLFERNGEKFLAVRGTEPDRDNFVGIPGLPLGIDLWSADLGQIGILGHALTQVVSLANLVMRLRAATTDTAVPQIRVEATLTPDYLDEGAGDDYLRAYRGDRPGPTGRVLESVHRVWRREELAHAGTGD